eukprot:SAG31_NODE_27050_length_432_cov_0.768769_1_plen_65_part_00
MLGAAVSVQLVRRSDESIIYSGQSSEGGLEIESSEAGTRLGGIALLPDGREFLQRVRVQLVPAG